MTYPSGATPHDNPALTCATCFMYTHETWKCWRDGGVIHKIPSDRACSRRVDFSVSSLGTMANMLGVPFPIEGNLSVASDWCDEHGHHWLAAALREAAKD